MRFVFLAFVLSVAMPGLSFGQGRIEQIRRDASAADNPAPQEEPKKQSNRSKKSDGNSTSSDDDDPFGLGGFVLAIFFSPYIVPRAELGDSWSAEASFPNHPYVNHYRGHLFFPEHDQGAYAEDETIRVRPWSLWVAAEEGNDFRGMNRVGLRASLDTSLRVGLSTNWNLLSESLDGGRRDSTWLSDTNVTFRFAQSERAQFHTGLGVRLLSDSTATHTGFNFLYGVDFFPRKPIIASALFDFGNVGSAFILHGRASVGANWRHFELYTGYDFLRIGSVNVQGPMLGLRFWY